MKRISFCLICLIFLLISSGCSYPIKSYNDINNLALIAAIGIDKITEGENVVRQTLAYKVPATSSKGEEQAKTSVEIISTDGKSIYDTYQKYFRFLRRTPSFSHANIYMIGESAARDDILKYIDVLTRDYELRLNSIIIIAKDTTAEQIIRSANTKENIVSKRIEQVYRNSQELSTTSRGELHEIMEQFSDDCLAPHIPVVSLTKKISKDDNSSMDLDVSGIAIFKNKKLIGYMNVDETRGFNWITNNMRTEVINVNDQRGNNVSLYVVKGSSKIDPIIEDNKISIKLKINVISNIVEQNGSTDIYNKEVLSYLIKQKEDIIRSEIEKAITFAKQNNTDVFNICGAVYHKYPTKWDKFKGNWDGIFPTIEYNVSFSSKIARTYLLTRPVGYKDVEDE